MMNWVKEHVDTCLHIRDRVAHRVEGKYKGVLAGTHISYCCAAFFEGHGFYALIALVLGLLILVGMVFHLDIGE